MVGMTAGFVVMQAGLYRSFVGKIRKSLGLRLS
jgi:hypothetical protein